MAKYEMKLQRQYYDLMLQGKKTVELRLNDEKRQGIQSGDCIVFEDLERHLFLQVDVVRVEKYKDFAALFSLVDVDCFGCDLDTLQQCLKGIYGNKDVQYGVVAIYVEHPRELVI